MSTIWLIIGICGLYFSIEIMASYNSKLYMYMYSNITLSKNIIISTICLVIGFGFLFRTSLVLRNLYVLSFLIFSYSSIWTLIYLIENREFYLEFILIPDYLLLILLLQSKIVLRKDGFSAENILSLKTLKTTDLTKLLLCSVIYNVIIYLANKIIS